MKTVNTALLALGIIHIFATDSVRAVSSDERTSSFYSVHQDESGKLVVAIGGRLPLPSVDLSKYKELKASVLYHRIVNKLEALAGVTLYDFEKLEMQLVSNSHQQAMMENGEGIPFLPPWMSIDLANYYKQILIEKAIILGEELNQCKAPLSSAVGYINDTCLAIKAVLQDVQIVSTGEINKLHTLYKYLEIWKELITDTEQYQEEQKNY